jgi:hypothetical protein
MPTKTEPTKTDDKKADEVKKTDDAQRADDEAYSPDQLVTYDQPAAAREAEKRADERVKELHEEQLDRFLDNVGTASREPIETVFANAPEKGGTPDSITIAQVGGELVLTITAKELHFGREEALALQRAVQHSAVAL